MRQIKEIAFRPFATWFHRVPPAILTLISLLFGILAFGALAYQLYWLAFFAWFFNRAFDALDGVVARMQNSQSDFGGYLDILVDFIVYALIPIGLVLGQPSTSAYMALVILLAVFYVNAASWMYLSAILEKRAAGAENQGEQTSVTMPAGIIGGTETIIFYSLFILFNQWFIWLFVLMIILVAITIIQRLLWAVKNLE
ncbi:MAG: CDP-alcohol phosphatidyltransferase family protein [Anaerolineae bacterium]|nr:CDP-alcohol phosphatidyltransferase family protein [Anaerolineae bacterium]